mmetsp:Transcript_14787/g.24556  ORF Transcript_14787/g.24556 Transcript_14787/m.24556 type:complete len:299 (+) Transcript_14787:184-1080(+)
MKVSVYRYMLIAGTFIVIFQCVICGFNLDFTNKQGGTRDTVIEETSTHANDNSNDPLKNAHKRRVLDFLSSERDGIVLKPPQARIRTKKLDSTGISVCNITLASDCEVCLKNNNDTNGFSWCTNPSYCFVNDNSDNARNCARKCGDELVSGDEEECPWEWTTTAIILTVIFFVVCPFAIIIGCVACCCTLCKRDSNKVYIEPSSREPVPILSVLGSDGQVQQGSNRGNASAAYAQVSTNVISATAVIANAAVVAPHHSDQNNSGTLLVGDTGSSNAPPAVTDIVPTVVAVSSSPTSNW